MLLISRDMRNKSDRPNLVFVFADQLGLNHCGYAGATKANTPNMDGLASQGVRFGNAVSTMPVCSAYRASLLTGKYPTSTGMVINELRMKTDDVCIGHVLTRAGYRTGYIGKWHLYANELGNHHDPKNSHIPPGPNRLGFDGYWAAYNFHHEYYNAYYHRDSPERISYGPGVYEPDGQTDLAIDFLRRAGRADQPFALFLSYGTPHDPWDRRNVPRRFYDLFRGVGFPPPPNYSQEKDPYGDDWSNMDQSPADLEELSGSGGPSGRTGTGLFVKNRSIGEGSGRELQGHAALDRSRGMAFSGR